MHTTLTNAKIWDDTGQPTFAGTIVIADDRIESVLRGDDPPPTADRTIDVAGQTVLPGLIDCHDHQTYHNTFGPLPMQ